MVYIFISYVHDDRQELAEELKNALEAGQQHKVFIDLDNNQDSEKSKKVRERKIEACDLFVILVTDASNESKWVYREFKLAEQYNKTVFPIKIDSGLPPHLLDYHAIEHKGSDLTPIIREMELAAIEIERRKERSLWRNTLVLVAVFAGIIIAYLLMRPQIDNLLYEAFAPTLFPTARPPRPTTTPIPRFYPIEGGGELVFSRTTVDVMDLHDEDIFLLDLETGEETQLTNNPEDNDFPAWSPDGSRITFETNRDGNYEIYVMNADGTEQTRLTNNEGNDRRPTWSPDGTQILFQSNRDGNYEIYVMNVDGTDQQALTEGNYSGVL